MGVCPNEDFGNINPQVFSIDCSHDSILNRLQLVERVSRLELSRARNGPDIPNKLDKSDITELCYI